MFHGGILSILETIFGVITLVAASLAVARSSLVKAQLAALRGDRDDLKERVERLETEKDDQKDLIKKQNIKIEVLEGVVTGKDQLDKIIALLVSSEARNERMEAMLVRLTNAPS